MLQKGANGTPEGIQLTNWDVSLGSQETYSRLLILDLA